jgi:hypothetical protein
MNPRKSISDPACIELDLVLLSLPMLETIPRSQVKFSFAIIHIRYE